MPEISVIVPVYKAEEYLHRCVDSILAQTFTDFELILVDDGSPDTSGKICDEYARKDSRVRAIHKTNGGVSSARNAGIEAANGNWIAFVDSDDYVADSYLTDLFEPEYDMTAIGYTDVYVRKDYEKPVVLETYRSNKFDGQVLQEIMNLNEKKWMSFCWCHLFNRAIIYANDLRFDTQHALSEDTLFVACYLVFCDSICVKDAVGYFYMHRNTGSLSTLVNERYFVDMTETDDKIVQTMETRFQVPFPRKINGGVVGAYVWYMGIVTGNDVFSFKQKYHIFRFIFQSEHFETALCDQETYFKDTSSSYRMVLRLKSPLIMLLALSMARILGKYKK